MKSMVLGQCLPVQTRVYANSESDNATGLFSSVQNPSKAVDADLTTFSTLNTGIAGTAIQYLKFPGVVTSGTPVTIKLSVPAGLLSLLSGVTVQPVDASNNSVGLPISDVSLATLLSGAGESEITVVPTGNYSGVAVSIGGLSVGANVNVYDAYYMKTTTINAGCNVPIDAFAGVRASTALGSIVTATGTATNPRNAIDADLTSYSELKVGAQALSEVYHTTLFNTLSQPGDTIKMILRDSGNGLLNVDLASTLTIQFYNGSTPVGAPIKNAVTPLALTLFQDASNKYELDISPPPATYGQYDRIEVQIGGLTSLALSAGLRIYDVKRVIKNPLISVNGSVTTTTSVCQGSTTTFAVGNAQDCTTYKWYDAATGGNLLQADPNNSSYTPSAAGLSADNNYYVEAVRNGCTEATVRTPVKLKVNPPPTAVATMGPTVCGGTPTISWAYTATNTPTTYSLAWDAPALGVGFVNVNNAVLPAGNIPVTVPVNAPTGTYTGTLYVTNANGCVSPGQAVSVAVDAKPSRPVINLTP